MVGPSYLQLACIMGERTADEKATFGKIKNQEDKNSFELNETKIDLIIDKYSGDTLKLLQDCVDRSQDKFTREFNKLDAANDQ